MPDSPPACHNGHTTQAVEKGEFSIWAVGSIQEGFEILTGVPTGMVTKDPETGDASFETDTAYDKVNKRLIQLGEKMNGEEEKSEELKS